GCCSTTGDGRLRSELARQISQPIIPSTTTPAIRIIVTRDCGAGAGGGVYALPIGVSPVLTSGRVPAPVTGRGDGAAAVSVTGVVTGDVDGRPSISSSFRTARSISAISRSYSVASISVGESVIILVRASRCAL